ncbi:MAG: hypothetical protein O7F73_17430 [Gammaproteobacteria bacterium]|nr:hypothetical protein [Gammaproteobacteria bacterium]
MSDQAGHRELERRWCQIFATLHAGGEVAPSVRLRAEGMMETLVLLGLAAPQQLQRAMARCYRAEFDESLAQVWGEHWNELFPFPQIPGFGQRAPVYPSTPDQG